MRDHQGRGRSPARVQGRPAAAPSPRKNPCSERFAPSYRGPICLLAQHLAQGLPHGLPRTQTAPTAHQAASARETIPRPSRRSSASPQIRSTPTTARATITASRTSSPTLTSLSRLTSSCHGRHQSRLLGRGHPDIISHLGPHVFPALCRKNVHLLAPQTAGFPDARCSAAATLWFRSRHSPPPRGREPRSSKASGLAGEEEEAHAPSGSRGKS